MKFLFLRDRTRDLFLEICNGWYKLLFLLSKKFEGKIYPVNLYVFKIFKYTVFSTIERMTAKKLWD